MNETETQAPQAQEFDSPSSVTDDLVGQDVVIDVPAIVQPERVIPGVRIMLVGGTQIDIPLVAQVGDTTDITQQSLSRKFAHDGFVDFPVTRTSISADKVVLFNMIDLRVMTQEEADAAAALAAAAVAPGDAPE